MQALQLCNRADIASNKAKIACKREQYKENQSRNEKWKTRTARWRKIHKSSQTNKQKRKQDAQGRKGKKPRDGSFIIFKAQNHAVTCNFNCWKKLYVKSIIFVFFLKEWMKKKAKVYLSEGVHLFCGDWHISAALWISDGPHHFPSFWHGSNFHLLNWPTPDMIWKTESNLETWSLLSCISASSWAD